MKELTEQEIDALIARAGLSGVMDVYYSAIEINTNIPHSEGSYWNGYRALAALLRAYGEQEREREREKIVQYLASFVASDSSNDWGAGYQAAVSDLAAAIRALPNE